MRIGSLNSKIMRPGNLADTLEPNLQKSTSGSHDKLSNSCEDLSVRTGQRLNDTSDTRVVGSLHNPTERALGD